jgi:energy-coupling factor transporter ATP-binding protein EcfA2
VPLIEIKNLNYTYAGVNAPALTSINLIVEKGEFLLLTGATGSGKTTLCRCVNGLIPHRYAGGRLEGSVSVSGLDTSSHPANEIALHCGYVFQNPENQLFALTVEKNVSFALENAGMDPSEIRSRVEWALGSVGMLELRKRPPYDLSGGQQQRVAIASALASQPEILIMDEPTSYLDPLTSKSIIGLAAELNKSQGMTIILVEHKLETAVLFASRITILKSGQIARDGDVRDILFGNDLGDLAVSTPKTILVYKALGKSKSTLGKMPLDPVEAGRSLSRNSK